MENMNIKSAYIHIPFCNRICPYCDFCKLLKDKFDVFKYLEALKEEINECYKGETLKTLYIGGGTPSSLNSLELDYLFEILKVFKLDLEYEFSFECNIEDITEELLIKLKENKVNRLSIGIQSFNQRKKTFLGRDYKIDVFERIKLCKKYFDNINIDLMYGVNFETLTDLKSDLESFIKLDLKHISIYSLILEDNTLLKINNYKEIEQDKVRDMYDLIRKTLKEHGYIHYEISNFSKPGYESKHNLTYWNNEKYYGFGLGASCYIGNARYTNTRSINNYLNKKIRVDEEEITKEIDMSYFMLLGLRKIKGVSEVEFEKRYNKKIEDVFNVSKLKYKDGFYYIDEDYLFVENQILVDFV